MLIYSGEVGATVAHCYFFQGACFEAFPFEQCHQLKVFGHCLAAVSEII